MLKNILLLTLLIFIFVSQHDLHNQHGGAYDPFAWFRPMIIIDFFRNFWLTK